MLLSLRKNGLDSLFKEVRDFKVMESSVMETLDLTFFLGFDRHKLQEAAGSGVDHNDLVLSNCGSSSALKQQSKLRLCLQVQMPSSRRSQVHCCELQRGSLRIEAHGFGPK